jgi:nicotinamidase-related amidase
VTTLSDRPNTALLVVDVQQGNTSEAYEREQVIANIGALVEQARAEEVPVVWVQHTDESFPRGSDAWQYAPELVQGEGEPVVEKSYSSAFEDTVLEDVLAERGVGRLVVTGAQTEACIRGTIHAAFTLGYDVTLVGDAHTTEDQTQWGMPAPSDIITLINLCWGEEAAPGRTAAVVDTNEVSFAG